MKTKRYWIYGSLLVLAFAVSMWIYLAQEKSLTEERAHRAKIERMTRESQEFEAMSSEQPVVDEMAALEEAAYQAALERTRHSEVAEEVTRRSQEARIYEEIANLVRERLENAQAPGQAAALQMDYEQALKDAETARERVTEAAKGWD